MTEFTLEHVTFSTLRGRADIVGSGYVRVGPVRLRIELTAAGGLLIANNPLMSDPQLEHAIAVAFRAAVLEDIKRIWRWTEEREAKHLRENADR